MPTGSKKRSLYTKEMLDNALLAVENGMSYGNASKAFSIPKTTLIYKRTGKLPMEGRPGPATFLTEDEENQLVKWLIYISKGGFPATREQLADSIELLFKNMKRDNPFPNGRPTKKWHQLFEKRHPEIALRVSQNLTQSRSMVTERKLRDWHLELDTYFKENNLEDVLRDPSRVYNCDESAFFLCPKDNRVLARKGERAVYSFVSNDDKECLTTLIMCNASGNFPPPMVVYPYKRMPVKISSKGPSGWALGRSDSGWMTGETFFEYIVNTFYQWLLKNKIPFPVVLFVDGHSSHLTLPLSEFCSQKKIVLVALFPNATHIIQPLDVAFFRPLKMAWKKTVQNWRMNNNGAKIGREDFAGLLEKSLVDVENKAQIIQNGFRATGLFPFNIENIDFKKYFKNDATGLSTSQQRCNSNTKTVEHIGLVLNQLQSDLPEKVKLFQACGEVWNGDIEDFSLFQYWKYLHDKKSCMQANTEFVFSDEHNPEEPPNILNNSLLNTSVIDNIITEVLDQNMSMQGIVLDGDSLVIPFDDHDIVNYLDKPDNEHVVETDSAETPIVIKVPAANEGEGNELIEDKISTLSQSSDKTAPVLNAEDNIENRCPNEKPMPLQTDQIVEKRNKVELPSMDEESPQINNNNNSPILPMENIDYTTPIKKNKDPVFESMSTPFKKTLTWPSPVENKNNKKRKPKDKIPSVATSAEWQEYYKRKEAAKRKLEEEKTARKEEKLKRAEKMKETKETLSKQRPKRKNDKRMMEEGSLKDNDSVAKNNKEKELDTIYSVEDYCVVFYNTENFPGKILEIKEEEQEKEYKISAMTQSGPNWKWPNPPDIIWYRSDELIRKINEPKILNKRGIYCVSEMQTL